MDNTTALILADSIDDCMEAADGLSLEQLQALVRQKAEEQRVAPEVLAAWAALDEGRAK